jgi:tetratricopeptide (TPR) repeat protein
MSDDLKALVREAYACLAKGELVRAVRMARAILKQGHYAGFEIAARAHAQAGSTEKAIRVLEGAVQAAPTAWPLWQLLGNYRSDARQLEKALEAYDQALKCPGADRATVLYNKAVALARADHVADALSALDIAPGLDNCVKILALKLTLLNDESRYEDALKEAGRAEAWLAEAENIPGLLTRDTENLARLFTQIGRSVWEAEGDVTRALKYARRAVQHAPQDAVAQALVRFLEGNSPSGD